MPNQSDLSDLLNLLNLFANYFSNSTFGLRQTKAIMKTGKTASGLRTIKGEDQYFVSLQLRSILQDHRTQLISNLINSDLNRYIDYKFDRNVDPLTLSKIRNRLNDLKQSGVNMTRYENILHSVMKFDFVHLGNALFFMEIDEKIMECFKQTELFSEQTFGVYHL
jgi:hypothetical protein